MAESDAGSASKTTPIKRKMTKPPLAQALATPH